MFNYWELFKSYLGGYSDYSVFNYIELIKSKSSSVPFACLRKKKKNLPPRAQFPVYHRPGHAWLFPAFSKYLLRALWWTPRKASHSTSVRLWFEPRRKSQLVLICWRGRAAGASLGNERRAGPSGKELAPHALPSWCSLFAAYGEACWKALACPGKRGHGVESCLLPQQLREVPLLVL